MSSQKSCKLCYKSYHTSYMEEDGWEYICTKCVHKDIKYVHLDEEYEDYEFE